MTETLFSEYRNWREGGECNWEQFKPVIETFIIVGIRDNPDLKGNMAENNLRWEGIKTLDAYKELFEK